MKDIRRKEKEITDTNEIKDIILTAKHVTIAMCYDNKPYLVTISHGFDMEENCIYFHCAPKGRKIDILKKNNEVWGQAMIDFGYQEGACDHLYTTAQFRGEVSFLTNLDEKRAALINMVEKLDPNPDDIVQKQLNERSIERVTIGRIDISYYSGKKSKEIIIQQ